MRLFKPLEHLQAALRASQLPSLRAYPIDQYTTIARQLSYAGYLSLDAVVWVSLVMFIWALVISRSALIAQLGAGSDVEAHYGCQSQQSFSALLAVGYSL